MNQEERSLQQVRLVTRSLISGVVGVLALLTMITVSPLFAIEPANRLGVGVKIFKHLDLEIEESFKELGELPIHAPAAKRDLAALRAPGKGRLNVRGGRWVSITPAHPLVPGRGVGNQLSWAHVGLPEPQTDAAFKATAGRVFRDYLKNNAAALRINIDELAGQGLTTVHGDSQFVQIHVPRVVDGVPVRGSYLTAVINRGNLVLFGTSRWGDVQVSKRPEISADSARAAVQSHVEPFTVIGHWGKDELNLVPMANGRDVLGVVFGKGYTHRLIWVVRPTFDNEAGRYEALVDARSGELISFTDTNHYADTPRESMGGVYPVSNDGISPDGVEQAGWPMPFDHVVTLSGTETTDSGGNLPSPVDGDITSSLSGEFVRINDNCGAISLTSSGNIDFGTSSGTDCATPGFGGTGNTHAARTGFHELNRIIEMGRSQLPTNAWLQQQLTANMNINLTCNASWGGGTVNFYREGGGCFNTGEIAGVFDHEWGHGLDDNDANPTISGPSGEGIADIYAALRLNDSCIGRNFRSTVCSGFGDPCLTCTGVRDIDYAKRASGNPHDYTWTNANCGGIVHCVGATNAEAVWDLWKHDLPALYSMDNNTAQEIVTRMTYIGAGNVGQWFSGGPPFGGCAANSGYMNYLAADDDNGNISDGTPHMQAIFDAFNRLEIACEIPTVVDSGCAGTPVTAPAVTTAPLDKSVLVAWGPVAGATKYQVFRTDGVFSCDSGKTKVGETTGTSLVDEGLQNGRDYSYVVLGIGTDDSCMGPASACSTVAPVAGPNLKLDAGSSSLIANGGDGDAFIDNCEAGTLSFNVQNTGWGGLTNVRITGVTLVSHPGASVTTSFPAAVAPSTLAQGVTGVGSFDFIGGGLSFGDTVVFQVDYTADELAITKSENVTIDNAETDLQSVASQTWDFESDLDGWNLIQGTFNQSTTGGGANGSFGYTESSANLDNQCDQIHSPPLRLTATSTLSVSTNFDIESFSGQWWDRANVAIWDGGTRIPMDPDGGRLYNASGAGASCVTADQNGWANAQTSWASSSWSSSAMGSAALAGQTVQIDVGYGTDSSVVGRGLWFDQVTVTDIELLVADVQSCNCLADLVLDITDNGTGTLFKASNSITAGSGFTVGATESVSFEAGNKVVLDNGFSVVSGGTFSVTLKACQ